MTRILAMYDKSYAHIGARLEALRLKDFVVCTFDKQGQFRIDGRTVPAEQMDVDYLWLSVDINLDAARDAAFETVLRCRSVKILQTFNAGLDHPVYKKIAAKGTRILNSSAQGIAIAEYVMAQVMALTHPIALQREQQARKEWKMTPFRELSQTNWLIVGFGPIGRELAQRVKAFGASVTVIRRRADPSPLADRVGTMADLARALPEADVVVLACALNADTRGMAGASFFSAIKPGAILVNIARGGLIDDAALMDALDRGQVQTAVLDVFHEEPLPATHAYWGHAKVRLTPHTSFSGSGVRGRWDQLFLDNIGRYARGEALSNEVNPNDL